MRGPALTGVLEAFDGPVCFLGCCYCCCGPCVAPSLVGVLCVLPLCCATLCFLSHAVLCMPCFATPCFSMVCPVCLPLSLSRMTLLRGSSAALCCLHHSAAPLGLFSGASPQPHMTAGSAAPVLPSFLFASAVTRGRVGGCSYFLLFGVLHCFALCCVLLRFSARFLSLVCSLCFPALRCVSVGSPLCWVGPFSSWALRRLLVLRGGCLGLTPWPSFFAVSDLLSWCDHQTMGRSKLLRQKSKRRG